MSWHSLLQAEYLVPLLAIGVTIVGFIVYYLLIAIPFSFFKNTLLKVLFQRILGVVLFGIFPSIILIKHSKTTFDFGIINFTNISIATLYWIIGLVVFLIPINLIFSRNKDNLKVYPQIRSKEWTIGLIALNTLSWVAYLFAYEFLFRGYLLFICDNTFGWGIAIAINTVLYSLAHLPKGAKETLGAIPLGILLCLITLSVGHIWIAFVAHVVMALSNDYIAIDANPKMRYKW